MDKQVSVDMSHDMSCNGEKKEDFGWDEQVVSVMFSIEDKSDKKNIHVQGQKGKMSHLALEQRRKPK